MLLPPQRGKRGGEPEKFHSTQYFLSVAKADVAHAEGDRVAEIASRKQAVMKAEKALEANQAAYDCGTISLDWLCQVIEFRTEAKLSLFTADADAVPAPQPPPQTPRSKSSPLLIQRPDLPRVLRTPAPQTPVPQTPVPQTPVPRRSGRVVVFGRRAPLTAVKQARITALKEKVSTMAKLAKKNEAMFQLGMRGGTAEKLAAAQYYHSVALADLAREQDDQVAEITARAEAMVATQQLVRAVGASFDNATGSLNKLIDAQCILPQAKLALLEAAFGPDPTFMKGPRLRCAQSRVHDAEMCLSSIATKRSHGARGGESEKYYTAACRYALARLRLAEEKKKFQPGQNRPIRSKPVPAPIRSKPVPAPIRLKPVPAKKKSQPG